MVLAKITPDFRYADWGNSNGFCDLLGEQNIRKLSKTAINVSKNIFEKNSNQLAEIWYSHNDVLLKILTASKALSIQVHPTNEYVAKTYKDVSQINNEPQKDEMGYVLSHMNAFCGFDTIENLIDFFKDLAGVIPKSLLDIFKNNNDCESAYKQAISYLLENDFSKTELDTTINDLLKKKNIEYLSEKISDLMDIYSYNQGDKSIFVLSLLRHFTLQKGSILFMPAGVPHAYVKGQIIEFMANSDNVLRAGLTKKPILIKNFIEALEFSNDFTNPFSCKKVCGSVQIDKNSLLINIDQKNTEILFKNDKTQLFPGESCVAQPGNYLIDGELYCLNNGNA